MNQAEILNFLSDHKSELSERFGVTRLGVAGSYARGENTPESDVDIIVSLNSTNTFRSFFGLLHFLQDSIPHNIDLATEQSLKPIVKKQILKDIKYV